MPFGFLRRRVAKSLRRKASAYRSRVEYVRLREEALGIPRKVFDETFLGAKCVLVLKYADLLEEIAGALNDQKRETT